MKSPNPIVFGGRPKAENHIQRPGARFHNALARTFACILTLTLVNLSVPMGGLTHLVPDPGASKPAQPPKGREPKTSKPLSARQMRSLQGKIGENPYLSGQSKWDVLYKGVNLLTGNFSTSGTDLAFEGGYGIPINVTRSYSANNGDEGPLGKGWTLSVDIRNTAGGLLKSSGGPVRSVPLNFKERPAAQGDPRIPDANEPVEAVIATDAGGTEETIQKDADGILTTPSWDKNRNVSEYETVTVGTSLYQILTRNTVTTPEGTVYVYEKKGEYPNGTVPWDDPGATPTPCNVLKPVSVTDRHGNVTTYNYGTTDVSFTKSNGDVTEKRLESIEMPNGHEIIFTWGNGTNAPINRIRTAGDGVRTITYGYTNGLLTSITTPGGKVTSYGYATPDVPIGFPGTAAGAVMSSITDSRGLTTNIISEMRGGVLLPYGVAQEGVFTMRLEQPNGINVYFGIHLDPGGSVPGNCNFNERIGGPTGDIINRGGVIYEVGVQPIITVHMVDHETAAGAQPWAPGTISWSKTYDANSQNLLSEVRHNKEWASYTFNQGRRILPESYADQMVTAETVYNFMGNPLEKTVTEHTVPSGFQTPPSDRVATISYAYWGRDKYYQEKSIKDQAGRASFTDYYDWNAAQGKKGQAYRVYDEKRSTFSNKSASDWRYTIVPANSATYSSEFDYDSKGRTTDAWKLQSTATSPWTYVQTKTTYGADSSPTWGAATQVVEDYGGGKINRTTNTLGYDSTGRTVEVQDPSGKIFETNYDLDGVVQSVYRTDSSLNQLIVGYTYGTSGLTNGSVTQITDGLTGVSQDFAYETTGGGKGQVASVTETNGSDQYTVSYTYNGAGKRETAVYDTPNGVTKWKYSDYIRVGHADAPSHVFQTLTKLDGSGSPTSEEFHYAYDFNGRLRNATFAMTPQGGQSGYSSSYPADTRGRAHYTYDPAGRTTNIEHYWDDWGGSSYTSTKIIGNHYDYEFAGSNRGLKSANEFYVKHVSNNTWVLDRTETYSYDAELDYLTGADYNDGLANENPSWSYDAAGNRNDATVVDNLNRATTIGGVARTYDILGNTLTKGSTINYSWDVRSRMTSFTSGLTTTNYQYRADGLRAKKIGAVTTDWFFYDGQMPVEIAEVGSSSTTVTRNGLGQRGIDRIERVNSSGTAVAYPLYDGGGNMAATLTKSGSTFVVADQRSYDAWGKIRSGNMTGDPKGRYAAKLGHMDDDESNLTYMRARYYDNEIGRFVSQDRQFDGPNWFVYCGNNPVNFRDFSGNNLDDERVKEDLEASRNALEAFLNSLFECADSGDVEAAWGQFMKVWGSGYMATDDAYWDIADKSDWIKKFKKGGLLAVMLYETMTAIKDGKAIQQKLEILCKGYEARILWYIYDIDNF